MKKLASLIGVLVCWKLMDQPKTDRTPNVTNYYFIKKGCGGNCHCGGHHE